MYAVFLGEFVTCEIVCGRKIVHAEDSGRRGLGCDRALNRQAWSIESLADCGGRPSAQGLTA